jgi:hypothetical protein
MNVAVVALLDDPAAARELAAGFEEEGVPLSTEARQGEALPLAREAARASALGLGIGGSAGQLVLTLAAAPRKAYLDGRASEARAFGHAAARLAAGRPLGPRMSICVTRPADCRSLANWQPG